MTTLPPLPGAPFLRVLDGGRPAAEGPLAGPVEIGRQQVGEPEAYTWLPPDGCGVTRLVIARQDERDNVSRRHALLEPLPSGAVRVTNKSRVALACPATPGGALAPGAAVELPPPFSLGVGTRTIGVTAAAASEALSLQSLDEQTIAPGRAALASLLRPLPPLSGPQLNEVVGWLKTTMGVLQAAGGAADFQDRALEAMLQIVGLDLARVLRLDGGEWRVAAAAPDAGGDPGWRPSQHVLAHVREQKKTFWQSSGAASDDDTPSLVPLRTVVAAPILDADGGVIGALYGERRRPSVSPRQAGGRLEATLVELLACGVSAGLARQAQEHAALEARVRFEQFFGPELADRLIREPNLLEARDATVTVLFCDVRGFSHVSEKLGPSQTIRWMNDVMGEVSRRVLDQGGVLVDYVGDEVMAMWGAPEARPDQAARAVRAALTVLDALPAVNERWQAALGGPTRLGIGINTGPAQVGNTGSQFKFKYGPHGTTVNLASRVQGLTKYLKCRLLVTRATRQQLGDGLIARRVVKARVVNIEEPVDLFEVEAACDARREFFAGSEAALEALENHDFGHAAHKAGLLLLDHSGDGPLL
ncbi:MAG TPA: adenylate/guanylate cyclase domain-containing protein, partial [Gemmataceae bacterium]|nr:adenylate/guanylate cyclase domain-containing protein [Gemmataceae bacterium]